MAGKKNEINLFTALPNFVDDLKLSHSAYRLFGHIVRICGGKGDGYCSHGVRTLSKWCSMSNTTIALAKEELKNAGLIEISEIKTSGGIGDKITLARDIWRFNALVYKDVMEELKNKDENLAVSAKQAKKRYRELMPKKETTFPDDFPIDEMRHWAKENVPNVDFDREYQNFRQISVAGQAKVAYWDEYFKKWLRQAHSNSGFN